MTVCSSEAEVVAALRLRAELLCSLRPLPRGSLASEGRFHALRHRASPLEAGGAFTPAFVLLSCLSPAGPQLHTTCRLPPSLPPGPALAGLAATHIYIHTQFSSHRLAKISQTKRSPGEALAKWNLRGASVFANGTNML